MKIPSEKKQSGVVAESVWILMPYLVKPVKKTNKRRKALRHKNK
jgi:hypothetical protein